MLERFARRLCLVTDIKEYSKHTTREQFDAQRRLITIMSYACARAGVRRAQPQKQGDGQLIVLPSGVDEAKVIPAIVHGLRHGIFEANRDAGLFGRIRLRAAMAQGAIADAPNGYVGPAVVAACRIADSRQLRAVLDCDDRRDLALAVTADLYEDVISQNHPGLVAADFEASDIAVEQKDFRTVAWLYAPAPGPAPASGGRRAAAIGSFVAAGAVAAGIAVQQTVSGAELPMDEWGHEHSTGHDGGAVVDNDAWHDAPDSEMDPLSGSGHHDGTSDDGEAVVHHHFAAGVD